MEWPERLQRAAAPDEMDEASHKDSLSAPREGCQNITRLAQLWLFEVDVHSFKVHLGNALGSGELE